MTLLDIKKIYLQDKAKEYSTTYEVLLKNPNAEIIPVSSHWNIPELNGNPDLVKSWNKVKREYLVLGVLSSMRFQENGRSTDYISPSFANGCSMACTYCYVARRKGYANPISIFVNYEKIIQSIKRHSSKLGRKQPNQCDPTYWTYDIGCNNDVSVDSLISDIPKKVIESFITIPNAKASFATKYVNRDMLSYDPQRKTRIRFSLMPHQIAKLVDVRTSPIKDRIDAIQDFYDAGYEVHINLSPVIVYDGWLQDYQILFELLADTLSEDVKSQLKAEVIFLTHNKQLHELNEQWHPKAEELLWQPELQESKISTYCRHNLRYKWYDKKNYISSLRKSMHKYLPNTDIRYIF
jgi:spore photoproduct lyase family protein